jgi:hypothetical protein
MHYPVLLIMAAGMASRYGGIKQLERVGPSGEIIMDYSIYAAAKAGFEDVVIVIKREMEADFENIIGRRLRAHVNLYYAYQDLHDLPAGYTVPEGRVKPWGTGHAVLAARDLIDGAMTVINADDYYGQDAFRLMYDFLRSEQGQMAGQTVPRHGLCTWELRKTLSLHGTVSRGICVTDADGYLQGIRELKKVAARGDDAVYTLDEGTTWQPLSGSSAASMNFFGLSSGFMTSLADRFTTFLDETVISGSLTAEYLLPEILGKEIEDETSRVYTMASNDNWFGVTYKEDRERVIACLQDLINRGVYPTPLW